MPGLNKSREELPWLYYPRSNSVRVINSHLGGGGGGGFDPESAWGLFDGSNDYVTIPGLQSVFAVGADFTVTVHFRQSNAASGVEHLIAWSDGTNHFTMGLDATNIGARTRASATNYARISAWTADSNVHVFQATWDASPAALLAYIDGTLLGTSGFAPVSPELNTNFILGARQSAFGNYFDGSIFYVSVHNRILTADELLYERSGGTSGTDPVSYLARYLFADGAGTVLDDSSGNSYDGTATNITEGTFWNP